MAQFTTAEVAEKFATDTRTLRKFLRADLPKDEQPGKGARYMIEGKALQGLKKRFKAWEAEAEVKKVEKVEEPQAEVEEIEDEDLEPTDDDLEAIDELDD